MLNGKTAIVTGGSRGIGRAIALRLSSLGADIAIIYAGNSEAAEKTAEECRRSGVRAIPYRCDISCGDEVRNTVKMINSELGNISVLINNAGVTKDGLVAMMSEDSWDRVIDTNLKGAYLMTRAVIPCLLRSKGGRIVNISSVSGLMGNAGQANYSASKAGLIGLTKSVARELAHKGITCNAIAPGFIRTDMTKDIEDNNPLLSSIPLGRMGEAEDVASAAAFLIASPYITGEVIRVDGGLAM